MTFDRDFCQLLESESRLPEPLADSNKVGGDSVISPAKSPRR